MGEFSGPGKRRVRPRSGLFGVTKGEEAARQVARARHERIEDVEKRKRAMLRGIVEGARLLEVRTSGRKLPPMERHDADGAVSDHQRGRLVLVLSCAQQLLRDRERLVQLSAHEVEDVLPVEHPKELRRLAELPAQLTGPGVGLACFRRGKASSCDQRSPERGLQVEFQACALEVAREALNLVQPPPELGDCFHGRRAADRQFPGLQPVVDRRSRQGGLGEVMGQQLGLSFSSIRDCLQGFSDAGM